MTTNGAVKYVPKIIAAGLTALCFLNILCLVYYNIPGHFSSNSGATDYVYPGYAYYSQMTEGFGHGRMNNEGFNNLEDFNSQKIDILVMGSSHMEGVNVAQTETTASVLNKLFYKSKYTYNIGFSTHNFLRNVNNLESAIQHYKPQEYVVLEIQNMEFSIQNLKDIANGKMNKLPSFNSGMLSYLQRLPYLRLGYRQFKFFTGMQVVDTLEIFKDENTDPEIFSGNDEYPKLLDMIMRRISQIGIDNKVTPIVFYHPHLALGKDGSASTDTDAEYLGLFKAACGNNGIHFMDMTDAFVEEYKRSHVLPHGFYNTAVGAGHLNKNGHRVIAEELFRQMREAAPGSAI